MSTPRPARKPETLRSILIIRPGGIGDAVLLIPAILAFREKYADASITVLAERRNGAVFSMCPAVDELVYYDHAFDLLKVVLTEFDAVVDTEQWHRLSAVVARATLSPVLSGFGTNERRRLFTDQIPYSHDDYEVTSFLRLFEPLGIVNPSCIPSNYVAVPPNAIEAAKKLLGDVYERPYIVIFPGASIDERRWGWENFRAAGENILLKHNLHLVVVGGSGDVADGDRIVAHLRGVNLAGKASLAETAAIIDKSLFLISGDSGILHLGVGLGRPTISLFGPGIALKWAPQGEKHLVINKNLDCSPCTSYGNTPKCPSGAGCMADIKVEEVVGAASKLAANVAV